MANWDAENYNSAFTGKKAQIYTPKERPMAINNASSLPQPAKKVNGWDVDAYNKAFGLTPATYTSDNPNSQINGGLKPNTLGSNAGRQGYIPSIYAFQAGIDPAKLYAENGLNVPQGSYAEDGQFIDQNFGKDTLAQRDQRIALLKKNGMSEADAWIEGNRGFTEAYTDEDNAGNLMAQYIAKNGRNSQEYKDIFNNYQNTGKFAIPGQPNQQEFTSKTAWTAPVAQPVPSAYQVPDRTGQEQLRAVNPLQDQPLGYYQATQAGRPLQTTASTALPTAASTAPTTAARAVAQNSNFRLPTSAAGYNSGFARERKGLGNSAYRSGLQYDY